MDVRFEDMDGCEVWRYGWMEVVVVEWMELEGSCSSTQPGNYTILGRVAENSSICMGWPLGERDWPMTILTHFFSFTNWQNDPKDNNIVTKFHKQPAMLQQILPVERFSIAFFKKNSPLQLRCRRQQLRHQKLMAEREWSPESKVALLKEEYKLKLSFGHTCLRDRIASQVDLIID